MCIMPRPQATLQDAARRSSSAFAPRPRARGAPAPTAPKCAWRHQAQLRIVFGRARSSTAPEPRGTLARLSSVRPPPALISRTPSKTSCHTSRPASNLANAFPVSFLPMSKCLQQLLQNMRGNVVQVDGADPFEGGRFDEREHCRQLYAAGVWQARSFPGDERLPGDAIVLSLGPNHRSTLNDAGKNVRRAAKTLIF